MRRHAAFTLIDLALVVALISLAFVILFSVAEYFILPPRGSLKRAMQNSYKVRSIHAGFVLYAQGNNSYYPGVMSDGVTINPDVGLTTQMRVSKLIEDNFIDLNYARSATEVQTNITSFALLQVNIDPSGNAVAKDSRNAEWKDTSNSESIVISDRAVPWTGSYLEISSIYTPTGWHGEAYWWGNIGWNDNHVTFETTSFLPTRFGTKSHLIDALFASPGDAHSGDDAFMVWSGTSDL